MWSNERAVLRFRQEIDPPRNGYGVENRGEIRSVRTLQARVNGILTIISVV